MIWGNPLKLSTSYTLASGEFASPPKWMITFWKKVMTYQRFMFWLIGCIGRVWWDPLFEGQRKGSGVGRKHNYDAKNCEICLPLSHNSQCSRICSVDCQNTQAGETFPPCCSLYCELSNLFNRLRTRVYWETIFQNLGFLDVKLAIDRDKRPGISWISCHDIFIHLWKGWVLAISIS